MIDVFNMYYILITTPLSILLTFDIINYDNNYMYNIILYLV